MSILDELNALAGAEPLLRNYSYQEMKEFEPEFLEYIKNNFPEAEIYISENKENDWYCIDTGFPEDKHLCQDDKINEYLEKFNKVSKSGPYTVIKAPIVLINTIDSEGYWG